MRNQGLYTITHTNTAQLLTSNTRRNHHTCLVLSRLGDASFFDSRANLNLVEENISGFLSRTWIAAEVAAATTLFPWKLAGSRLSSRRNALVLKEVIRKLRP